MQDWAKSLIHVHTDADPAPDGKPLQYVVAGNGLLKVVRNDLFECAVAVTGGVPGLPEYEEGLRLKLPRLPQRLVELAVGFFQDAHDAYHSEAIILVHYNREANAYRFVAPFQTVEASFGFGGYGGGKLEVDYKPVVPDDGWQAVGDIHSHGSGSAYQSETDEDDAEHQDGLHVVVGKVSSKKLDWDVEFTVSGTHFKLGLEEVVAGFDKPRRPAPKQWMKRVSRKPSEGLMSKLGLGRRVTITTGGISDGGYGYDAELPYGHDGFGAYPDRY